ncbi:MAG: AtpZ/AtpI family protein [Polyangiaceae bacterium]|nr:AtpZ/AtpI family protein [Polyangiaceae bacterium]
MLFRRFGSIGILGRYAAMGLDFVVAIAIGFGCGWWLDGKLGFSPWLTIAGLVFGVAAGFNTVFKLTQKLSEATAQDGGTVEPTDGQ